jgi:hypothetical protein
MLPEQEDGGRRRADGAIDDIAAQDDVASDEAGASQNEAGGPGIDPRERPPTGLRTRDIYIPDRRI